MASGKICAICAWRETCQKKFSISKKPGATCPDFTRDVSIPLEEGDEKPAGARDVEGRLKRGVGDG
jgi:hypothetical protein